MTAMLTTRDKAAAAELSLSMRQAVGQLTIGLVNNMPDAAIRATERQFGTLLQADGLDVRLRYFHLPQVPRSPSARSTFLNSYAQIDELWEGGVDGLIVTGAEPRAPRLQDEPYWHALCELIDWAENNTISTIWSCLATHAAVLHLDGVERRRLATKLFGVFGCSKVTDHPMLAGSPAEWPVPHSRLNDLDRAELAARGYVVLASSSIAGADTFLKQRNSLFIFFQGHLEYDAQTLLREYIRDISRFINGERDSYPDMPRGYFNAATGAEFERIRNRAIADRNADILVTVAESPVAKNLINSWRGSATNIYRNWLHYLADEKRRRLAR
jgi:homoserine O-succinyltransferase